MVTKYTNKVSAKQKAEAEKKDIIVPCAWCGKATKQRRHWQRFCCPEHARDFHKDRYRRAKELLDKQEKLPVVRD